MIELDTRLSVPQTVAVREIDGEAVLVDLHGGNYYGLNGTATDMWRYLVELGSPGAALAAMIRTHDVPAETLQRDLLRLVEALVKRSLLQISPPE